MMVIREVSYARCGPQVCLLHYDFSSAMPDLNAGKVGLTAPLHEASPVMAASVCTRVDMSFNLPADTLE